MYFKQAEIFWGLDKSFVGELFEGAEKITGDRGDALFEMGDPAIHFFILIKGQVKIQIDGAGKVVYHVSHAGELFGWSSLVGRESYSASAVCSETTHMIRINRNHVQKVCWQHPESGVQFYQRMAGVLGNRLVHSYRMLISDSQADMRPTSGTGQVMESVEAI